jgi:phosphoenolpyruvate carboxylase
VRQEGPDLLELVETVRTLTRTDPVAAAELLRDVDEQTAARLVRAFNAYFHLANVVEQVHRGRELQRRRAADGGWLWRTARLFAERSVPVDELERVAHKLEVRPVFTAHPTEAARRSTLTKLHALADLLDAEAAEAALRRPDLAEPDRALSEVIDLAVAHRRAPPGAPEPVDEARNGVPPGRRRAAGRPGGAGRRRRRLRPLRRRAAGDGGAAALRHVDGR